MRIKMRFLWNERRGHRFIFLLGIDEQQNSEYD